MAGIVNEAFTVDVNVQEAGAPEPTVNVRAWNQAGTSVIDKTTDAQGDITPTVLIAKEHSITLTSTRNTTDFNPFQLRALKWLLKVLNVSINLSAPSKQTLFAEDNTALITQTTQATVQAYTGITFTHASDLVTTDGLGVSPVNTMDEFYDRAQDEAIVNEQVTPDQVLERLDAVNYILKYDWTNDGQNFLGQNRAITMDTGKSITIQGAGGNIQDLSVTGDVNLGTGTGAITLTNLNIPTGTLDFSIAGTYTLDNCQIDEVTNSSGGAVTIQAVNGTQITTNTGPNITIENNVTVTVTVVDVNTGNPIQGAAVKLIDVGSNPIIDYAITDASGEVSTTFNYGAGPDVNLDPAKSFARKGTSSPVYKPSPIAGTIKAAGFSATIPLIPDGG